MIKVVHIVDSLEPGGMENGIVNVARALAGDGFEIHACCLRRRGEFAARMPAPALVQSIDKNPGFSWKWVRELRTRLRIISPDIVHTHNLGPLIYAAGATRFGRRYPIVHGEHAELSPGELSTKRLLLRKVLYRSCSSIHTVSESLTGNLASANLPTDRVTTIPNGVDTTRFSDRDDATAGQTSPFPFPGDRAAMTVLGVVGRFGEFKRHIEMLDAFDGLAPGEPGLRLLVVGDGGPMRDEALERIAASPFSERIHWAGFQSEPAPFYRMMDLLVVPSSNEGLSNVCLEALACGTPVLANESCGSREILSGCPAGRVVAMPGADDIRSAILGMTSPPELLLPLKPQARAHVLRNFSMREMVGAYRRLYRAVAPR